MKRTLAVFGLLCAAVAWNFYPPWLFQRPGRPVCIEFHPLKWDPVITNELTQPTMCFDLLFVGDVAICLLLAACFVVPGRFAIAESGLTRRE